MALRYRQGDVTVELDDGLERVVRRAVDAVLPGVLERMEIEARDLLATARGEWPVRTGESRGGLRMVTEISVDGARVAVENPVDYAIYVRPRAWYGATTAWERLVRTPMRQAARDLAREIGPQIVAALRGT